ncbi:hypothetical protein [Streptomyces sp. NPDC055140]
MAITARNPRRARLAVTLAGIILVLVGIPLWGTGDMDQMTAEQEQINNSAGYWGQEIGFDSGEEDAYNAAVADAQSAETRMNIGIVMMVLGLVTIGSRWLIRAAPPAMRASAGGKLTPEQEQQAIAMYLEAQRRQTEQ